MFVNKNGGRKLTTSLLALGAVSTSFAGGGFFLDWDVCFDPANTDPLSASANTLITPTNGIMFAIIGLSGDYTFSQSGCGFPPFSATTHDIPGAIAFMSGDGSLVSPDDDLCAITGVLAENVNQTIPAPALLAASNRAGYATVRVINANGDIEDSKWGEDGYRIIVAPNASNRRATLIATLPGGIDAQLILYDVGPALRFEWTLTNLNAEAVQVGMRFGQFFLPRMGQDVALMAVGKTPYILHPLGRPQLIHQIWDRSVNQKFPEVFDFFWGQSFPYPGIRFRMNSDALHPDQTRVDRVGIGGIGAPWTLDSLWDFPILPDAFHNAQFAFWFDPVSVPAGGSRKIVFYAEPPSVASDYRLPYMTATETEYLLNYDNAGLNELSPNPFTIYAYLDNQYAQQNQTVTIPNADLTINLPPGLSLAPGEMATKSTGSIAPNQLSNIISWDVESDGVVSGPMEYTINVVPVIGPQRTIKGRTIVSLTPRVDLANGPTLVTFPWVFGNPSFAIIGVTGTPYNWDVATQSYVVATNAERGRGQWLVNGFDPPPQMLIGASAPGDKTQGEFYQILHRGWNLIGNPYQYPVQLNQLIAVSDADPTQSFTWEQISSRGWVRSTWFRYDPAIQDYRAQSNPSDYILAGVGYWIYVNSIDEIKLLWPPVFLPNLQGSFLGPQGGGAGAPNWQIKVGVTGARDRDLQNVIGAADDGNVAEQLSAFEPPKKPFGNMQFTFVRNGVDWASDIRPNTRMQTFTGEFRTDQAGLFKLEFPEARNLPANMTATLKDVQTGRYFNMKTTSNYAFSMNRAGVRRFEITVVTR